MTRLPSLPQGMGYGNWDFGRPTIESLEFDIEIVSGDEQKPGRYFQLYDGNVGRVGKYFGFQSDLFYPGRGWIGKGLLYSRWGSNNLADARVAPNGYIENDPVKEDGFIGVRIPFDWTLGRYTCWFRPIEDDGVGRWYEFRIRRRSDGMESSPGSLRFPNRDGKPPLINNGCGTWTEAYGHPQFAPHDEDVPTTVLVVQSVVADGGRVRPLRCKTEYNPNFPAADAFIDQQKKLTIASGKGVTLTHSAGVFSV